MAVRKQRRRRTRKQGGHPFLVVLFFISLILCSAYVTDRMTNAPDAEVSENVPAVGEIFNDKEMKGLVPKEDQGTPESLKEKLKAAIGQFITVKTDDDVTDVETTIHHSGENENAKAPAEEKEESSFSISSIVSKITGNKESGDREKPLTPASDESSDTSSREETEKSERVSEEWESAPVIRKETGENGKSSSSGNSYRKPAAQGVRKPETSKRSPRPQVSGNVKGKLAVVIDDAGRDLASQHVYESLGVPLTLAVMPNQVHTRDAALSWHAHGLPVILHQPMESVSGRGMENKVILTSMSDTEIRQMLKDSLSQVPEAIGINNHQGSKATTDRHTMDVVMNELHHRRLFFFDSRTNSTTAADGAAASYGVPYVRNDLFVDNEADVAAISAMIREGARKAEKYGTYVIIGHCRPKTAEAFRQMVPKLQAEGIEFVYVSSLAR